MTASTAQLPQPSGSAATRRAIWNTIRGSLGNLVEWYDVYIYTVFASYFEKQFFDQADENATVYIYAIFAITFVMRPIGSWFFGRFADRRGRRAALTFSADRPHPRPAGPGVRDRWRVRHVGDIHVGGGDAGAARLLLVVPVRHAGGRSRASPVHVADRLDGLQRRPGSRVRLANWLRRRWCCCCRGVLAAPHDGRIAQRGNVEFYTYSVNAPAIVKTAYKSEAMTATWINLLGLIFLMLLQPVGGIISDKVGRKPLLLWFGIGGLFYTYVLITYLPQTRSPIMSFLLVAVGYVILTGYTSINALVKSELFPAHVRALGVGVGYALANSIFGGTATLIYQAMKARDQVPMFIASVTVCIAVSLVVYIFFIKNKSETYLDREQGAAFR